MVILIKDQVEVWLREASVTLHWINYNTEVRAEQILDSCRVILMFI